MNRSMRLLATVLFLVMFVGSLCEGEVIYADSYADGVSKAKSYDCELVVLVHGSDWNRWGERVYGDLFEAKSLEKEVVNGRVVLADVDVLQSADEEERKANDERNEGFVRKGIYTFPAVAAYSSDGVRLGVVQGVRLGKELDGARAEITGFVEQCQRHGELSKAAELARKTGDKAGELEALIEIAYMPLSRPEGLMERIKELDPQDSKGHYARLSFPGWYKLFADVTGRTKNGEGAAVVNELKEMLKSDAYTAEQRALIYAAMGNCYRLGNGQGELAGEAFKKAWGVAPDTFGGEIGRRCYEAWYSKTAAK